jgi:hypothetical protein
MATFTIILLLLLAATIMPVHIDDRFTQEELAEIGVYLDSSYIGGV